MNKLLVAPTRRLDSVSTDDDEALVLDGAAPEGSVVKPRDFSVRPIAQDEMAHLGSAHPRPCRPQPLHEHEDSARREQVEPSHQRLVRVGHSPKDVSSDDRIE